MRKLLTFAAVLAALGLARARAGETDPAAPGVAPPAAAHGQRAAKRTADGKKAGKKPAAGAKAAKAKGGKAVKGSAEAKPCEPVKPCPID